MQPIEHRAREIMGALWDTKDPTMRTMHVAPIDVALLLARAERAMIDVGGLFREQPADGDDAPHLREVIALRSTLALIQSATKERQ